MVLKSRSLRDRRTRLARRMRGHHRNSGCPRAEGRIIVQDILSGGGGVSERGLRGGGQELPIPGRGRITLGRRETLIGRTCRENRTLLSDFCGPDDDLAIFVGDMAHGPDFFGHPLTVESDKRVSLAVAGLAIFHDFRLVDDPVNLEESFQLFLRCFVAEPFDENPIGDFHVPRAVTGVVILVLAVRGRCGIVGDGGR